MVNLYNSQDYIWDKSYKDEMLSPDMVLSEKDFYPPEDNRVLKSFIYDIGNDINFEEYSKYIFDLYEEEEMYEN